MQSVVGRDWSTNQLIPHAREDTLPYNHRIYITCLILMDWWSMWDSNPRSPACKAGALAI